MKRINEELSRLLGNSVEADEKLAVELSSLQTWADKFMRDIDEQRHAVKLAVDTQTEHMLQEMQVFKSRIDDAVAQLRGRPVIVEHENHKEIPGTDPKVRIIPRKNS